MSRCKNFYKIFLIFSFFSCANEKIIQIQTFPEFKVKTGSTRSFDLGNYLSSENLDLRFQNENNHELEGNILTINGVGVEEGFELVKIWAGKQKIDLVIRYLPMVKHKFMLKSASSSSVFIMGSFNDWSRSSLKMAEVNNGLFEIEIQLEPQKYEYKFIINGDEVLDPLNDNVVSNNIGGYNSLIDLSDKNDKRSSQLLKKKKTKDFLFFEYIENNELVIPSEIIALFNNYQLPDSLFKVSREKELIINISSFTNGFLRIYVKDFKGNYTDENRTVISSGMPLNTDQDSWHFKIIYNVLVDRFFDGNKQNNKKIPDPKLHKLANFNGGDILGINKKINEGYFSDLGVNAIWVSPIQKQPDSSYVEYIKPNRSFSGYHGYWPVEPRQIDLRFGTEEDFLNTIEIAHERDIKVLLDFVSNHVHQDHIYFKENENWFGNFFLEDGTPNIRLWDGKTMLTTWFDEFLPSFDYSNNSEAINQSVIKEDINQVNNQYHEELLKNQDVEKIIENTSEENEVSFSKEAIEESESEQENSVDLKEFGVNADEPDLFSSDNNEISSENLLSSSNDEKEDDDLEIPAFLRRQKN